MKSEQRERAIIIIYDRRNVVVSRRKSRPDSFCIKISEAGSRPPNAFFLKCFLNPHLQNNFPPNPTPPPRLKVCNPSRHLLAVCVPPVAEAGPRWQCRSAREVRGSRRRPFGARGRVEGGFCAHLSPFLAGAMSRNKGSSENGVYHRNDNISQMPRREI